MDDTLRCTAENLAIGTGRAAGGLRGRIDTTRRQVEPYRRAWARSNAEALAGDRPLWVVLGDSAAQGVGASSPFRGWVGQVRERMGAAEELAVLNLSVSGARVGDVLADQLPALYRLRHPVALVTCVIGGNDVYRSTTRTLTSRFAQLMSALPAPGQLSGGQRTIVTTLPQGLGRRRAGAANALIARSAPGRGLEVADLWATTGPPWQGKFAADLFHPNDVGYADWADAIHPVVDGVR